RIWDLETRKEVGRFTGHDGWVQSAFFSPGDGKFVLTGSRDKTARIWDTATGKQLASIRHEEPLQYAAYSPDGTMIVTSAGPNIFLWSVEKVLEAGASQGGNGEGPHSIQFPAYDKAKPQSSGHSSGVLMVTFSHDGKKIVSASFDKTVKIW